ncbi:MAG: hypothetical protein Q8755_02650, partial [Candidatus Phytoplasma australasiaticum]|nr:hypothetical protein [Candidatus Phytoplasma australasiaticum]
DSPWLMVGDILIGLITVILIEILKKHAQISYTNICTCRLPLGCSFDSLAFLGGCCFLGRCSSASGFALGFFYSSFSLKLWLYLFLLDFSFGLDVDPIASKLSSVYLLLADVFGVT